jgi:hypothetical protein
METIWEFVELRPTVSLNHNRFWRHPVCNIFTNTRFKKSF